MHCLLIGGTGFLGYHIIQRLLQDGHQVSLLCRSSKKAESLFGQTVNYHIGDLDLFHNIDFTALFNKVDTIIYAAGVDERVEPVGDPYQFFYKENVTSCVNLLEQAKKHGVKRAIIMGSIFTYWNRQKPEMQLAKKHAYIRSRQEQIQHTLALADKQFRVNIAELPFVLGTAPLSTPLWVSVVNYVRLSSPLFITPGGNNFITVESVAEAVVGIIQHVRKSEAIPVGDQNMSWKQMMKIINRHANRTPKPINQLPDYFFHDLGKLGAFFQKFVGKQSGLDYEYIAELVQMEAYIDTEPYKKRLHYQSRDLENSFALTIAACPKQKLMASLERSLDWISENTQNYYRSLSKYSTKNQLQKREK